MNNLPDDMKIACCKTCLLSDAMKDCKACPFNIGLVFKALEAIKANESKDETGKELLTIRKNSLILA